MTKNLNLTVLGEMRRCSVLAVLTLLAVLTALTTLALLAVLTLYSLSPLYSLRLLRLLFNGEDDQILGSFDDFYIFWVSDDYRGA